MVRRLGATGWLAAAMAIVIVPATGHAEPRRLLVTRVTWLDGQSNTGTMLFQGTVDSQGNLDGLAYPGDGAALAVTGTVDANGDISGSLDTTESEHVGTFTGELNEQDELEGTVVVDGEVDFDWDAPADDLPLD